MRAISKKLIRCLNKLTLSYQIPFKKVLLQRKRLVHMSMIYVNVNMIIIYQIVNLIIEHIYEYIGNIGYHKLKHSG